MKKVITITLILLVAVTLSGCGKKTAEKTAEKAVTKSTNGAVDVDVDDETITVNVNGNELQAGEDVSLPDDFPEDIHIAEGTLKSALTVAGGHSVTIETSSSVSTVKDEYSKELDDDGWTITADTNFGTGVFISAEKDNRTVTVSISMIEDVTTIIISSILDEE